MHPATKLCSLQAKQQRPCASPWSIPAEPRWESSGREAGIDVSSVMWQHGDIHYARLEEARGGERSFVPPEPPAFPGTVPPRNLLRKGPIFVGRQGRVLVSDAPERLSPWAWCAGAAPASRQELGTVVFTSDAIADATAREHAPA